MARYIKSIIELTQSQTNEFLANLRTNKNEKNRQKTIKKALKTKFNVF